MEIVDLNCPICNNNNFKLGDSLFDDRYGEPNIYRLSECTKCKHICTFPRMEEKDLSDLYSNFYPRKEVNLKDIIRNSHKTTKRLSWIKRWLDGTNNQGQYFTKPRNYVLDIGCGDCQSLVEAKLLGGKVFGVDPDKNVEIISNKLSLNVYIGSIHENLFSNIKFDLIILNQVLEHIPNPNKLLKEISNKLSQNGQIIISTPNVGSFYRKLFGTSWINWHIPYHLHHFRFINLKSMLINNSFEILQKKTITPNAWTIIQFRNIFQKNIKGNINKIWLNNRRDIHTKTSFKIIENKFLFLIIKSLFVAPILIFNRLIDFLGQGDSLFLIIKKKNR